MSSPGDALWHLSRAAGLTAYVSLTLAVTFGLLVSTRLAARWISGAQGVEVHRWLSSVTLVIVGAHAAALLGDRAARFDLASVLVPFAGRYRPFAVGLGILAAYTALVIHVSSALRGRIGARAWRVLHFASFGLYGLSTAHGLLAGSDAGLTWTRLLYLASLGLVVGLTGHRALRWKRSRRVSSGEDTLSASTSGA